MLNVRADEIAAARVQVLLTSRDMQSCIPRCAAVCRTPGVMDMKPRSQVGLV